MALPDIIRPERLVLFSALSVGETFACDGKLHVKIDQSRATQNAYCFDIQRKITYSHDDQVIPRDIEIRIK